MHCQISPFPMLDFCHSVYCVLCLNVVIQYLMTLGTGVQLCGDHNWTPVPDIVYEISQKMMIQWLNRRVFPTYLAFQVLMSALCLNLNKVFPLNQPACSSIIWRTTRWTSFRLFCSGLSVRTFFFPISVFLPHFFLAGGIEREKRTIFQ